MHAAHTHPSTGEPQQGTHLPWSSGLHVNDHLGRHEEGPRDLDILALVLQAELQLAKTGKRRINVEQPSQAVLRATHAHMYVFDDHVCSRVCNMHSVRVYQMPPCMHAVQSSASPTCVCTRVHRICVFIGTTARLALDPPWEGDPILPRGVAPDTIAPWGLRHWRSSAESRRRRDPGARPTCPGDGAHR